MALIKKTTEVSIVPKYANKKGYSEGRPKCVIYLEEDKFTHAVFVGNGNDTCNIGKEDVSAMIDLAETFLAVIKEYI
jgi:hypothetical protein